MAWTTREQDILEVTSRVSSAFSLLGASFIILTFCTSKRFHRPINRLAFYAAFGNILTNFSTLTSIDGIRAGSGSPLCRVQAVFIQWFMPADALFCLAMAWNVYLTVFKKYTTIQLRRLEPFYVVGCYGLPFILALSFLFVENRQGIALYGPATMWCWISKEWQVMRIAGFYGPVWVVLIITFFIYVLAGRVIFKLRKSLRSFAGEHRRPTEPPANQIVVEKSTTVQEPAFENIELAESKFESRTSSQTGDMITTINGSSALTSYTCTITSGTQGNSTPSKPLSRRPVDVAMEANTAAWAYCRCAMLFFLALVITWLPSSVNRVYNLADPDATNFPLSMAAVLVLPCQGFWNGLIYAVTSLPACKAYMRDIKKSAKKSWGAVENRIPRRGRKRIEGE